VSIRELLNNEPAAWWADVKIGQDFRFDPANSLPMVPESLRERMLLNHLVINKESWEREHIEWLTENTSDIYYVDDRNIFFSENNDLVLFLLKFD
jgi:hypothetical protein